MLATRHLCQGKWCSALNSLSIMVNGAKNEWKKKANAIWEHSIQLAVTCWTKSIEPRNDCQSKNRKCQTKWKIQFIFRYFQLYGHLLQFVRLLAFFFHSLSLVESRAKHLSFALFLIAVVFRLQRCDQDSYITGHSDTMHVHTSGHMWIFLNESFIFCFTVAFNRTGKKLLDIFVLDGRLSAAKEQISSWNTTTKGPTRMKKLQMSCYWSQSSSFILQLVPTILQFTLHICWCLHTDRHTCTQTNKKSCFLLDWSTNVIKSAAKPSDQCKQTIK